MNDMKTLKALGASFFIADLPRLGGGLKYFAFSSLFGEMIQI